MRYIAVLGVAAACLLAGEPRANAMEFCAYGPGWSGRCGFPSLDVCLGTIRRMGGDCVADYRRAYPYAAAPYAAAPFVAGAPSGPFYSGGPYYGSGWFYSGGPYAASPPYFIAPAPTPFAYGW